MRQPDLRVEGKDDLHALVHLLLLHGIPFDATPAPPQLPKLKEMDGIANLLEGMEKAVQSADGLPVGFVLDADSPLSDRWAQVRGRLTSVNVETPEIPPREGFIGESGKFKCRVGVWLMPDNQHDGKLETFLRELIDGGDPLIGHACSATEEAVSKGAKFRGVDTIKAEVHAWLAWQKRPGEPFGRAIQAKYFQHNSPAAGAFVAWFKTLYGLP